METTYEPDRKRKKRRPPPPLSPQYLHDEARRYLDRYTPSASQLKRVLMRRVYKCIRFHGGEREEGAHMVDELIDKLERTGVIDDARFAQAWATSLNRRGIPARGIRARLRQKGVSAELVDDALQALDDEMGQDAELLRACAYARRRRLGPCRMNLAQREARAKKDLAAMARAGFSYAIARRVIYTEDFDALVEAAEDGWAML